MTLSHLKFKIMSENLQNMTLSHKKTEIIPKNARNLTLSLKKHAKEISFLKT